MSRSPLAIPYFPSQGFQFGGVVTDTGINSEYCNCPWPLAKRPVSSVSRFKYVLAFHIHDFGGYENQVTLVSHPYLVTFALIPVCPLSFSHHIPVFRLWQYLSLPELRTRFNFNTDNAATHSLSHSHRAPHQNTHRRRICSQYPGDSARFATILVVRRIAIRTKLS